MRGIIGKVGLSFASLALVGGPVFGFVIAPRLSLLPVEIRSRQVSEGRGVYLDPQRGFRVVGPVELRNVHEIQGDSGSSSASVAVWDITDRTVDVSHRRRLDGSSSRYALDRRTGLAVTCCGVDEDRRGALVQTFPPGTGRTSYPWWDGTAVRAFPARFVGLAEMDGIDLYRFRVTVSPIVVDRIEVPPDVAGRSGSEPVQMDWWYRSQTYLLVEPSTGVVVKGSQVAHQWLADDAGKRRLTVADTDLADTPATVANNLVLAKRYRATMDALRVWPLLVGPLVALTLVAVIAARWDRPSGTADRSARAA